MNDERLGRKVRVYLRIWAVILLYGVCYLAALFTVAFVGAYLLYFLGWGAKPVWSLVPP